MAKGKNEETSPEYYARLLDILSDEPSEEAVEQMASVDSTIQAIIEGQTVEQARKKKGNETDSVAAFDELMILLQLSLMEWICWPDYGAVPSQMLSNSRYSG